MADLSYNYGSSAVDRSRDANVMADKQLKREKLTPEKLPFSAEVELFADETGLNPPSNIYLGLVRSVRRDTKNRGNIVIDFGNFLNQFSSSNPIKNWENFETGWYETTMGSSTSKGELYKAFVQEFATAMGIELDSANHLIGGDWAILNSVSPPIDLSNPDSPNNPFVGAFNLFLSKYHYSNDPENSSPTDTVTNFIDQFQKFLVISGSATLQNGKSYADPTSSHKALEPSTTFELFYKSVAENPSDEAFEQSINNFYEDQMQQYGYFLPGISLSEWITTTHAEKTTAGTQKGTKGVQTEGKGPVVDIGGPSWDEKTSSQMQVIWRVMRLLIELVTSLEKVAITQTERLTFYTKFQAAYTNIQSKIPVFLKGDIDSKLSDNARNDLNSVFNANLMDTVRAFRDIQADNAKKEQSNINISQDSRNAMIEMVSSFLQQLSGLTSALLR